VYILDIDLIGMDFDNFDENFDYNNIGHSHSFGVNCQAGDNGID
jgi:hypothetical protein